MSFQQCLTETTLEKIKCSLIKDMPSGIQRDFYLWGISDENPNRHDFLQLVGMNQVINLTTHILEPMIGAKDWQKIAEYSGLIHAYFMYELVSDDLAVGLSLMPTHDTSLIMRKDILHSFNGVMVKRLSGVPNHSSELLTFIQQATLKISGYSQPTTREKYVAQFQKFMKAHPEIASNGINFELWPILIANIESCKALLEATEHLQTGPVIHQGFINRYASVSQSLEAHINMTLEELTNIGTHTVSVIPVLAYFIGIMNEVIDPQPELKGVVEDGLLEDALATAATIIRILNDMGVVATYSTGKRTSLIHTLWKSFESKPPHIQTMSQLLCHVGNKTEAMTRFQKDILHGEFNICLHNLAFTESIEYGISIFNENLTYFAQAYRHSQMHLRDVLTALDRRLGSNRVSSLISGFINFHEQIYTHRFDTTAGEYVA
ncbi:MAG: hypothetical protein GC179_25340 [Anaerolineaceae bacterium]|nr:hypothetical protein [Anaerolineaceae bacterium]